MHHKKILFFLFISLLYVVNACQAQTNSEQEGTPLNILTWNLYMRPRIGFHDGQVKRAPEIAKQLIDKDYDVIVFQEAFDNKARRILWKHLKEKYPYQSGSPKHKYFFKVSTGVFIVSKHPLKVIDDIYFSDCGGSDCFAVKGAVLVSLVKNNHKIQIVGTHLQAANGKKKTGTEIRKIQYDEIVNKLLKPYAEPGVPQFFAGDLNTKKHNKEAYEQLLKDMEMEDGDITGENQYSSGGSQNDFRDADDKASVIDYVLCKKNGADVKFIQRSVKIFRSDWSKEHKDLSDHYAVLANILLK
ncbi:MAG: sphingomyelin phosphodiesterase [Bacteroidia bacterium]|jgi:sphingomyelin phosphodiesterase